MTAPANASPARRVNRSAIQPRRMDFQFGPDVPRYWFAGSQFKSILLTALSCTFPEGERMFVRAVRHYQPTLRSAPLKEEVKGFIGQEAHHGNEHEAFNALMQSRGVPTAKVEKFVHNGIRWQEKHMSPERRLAKTCALEHFTAMLAEMMLENPAFFEGMHKDLLPLWVWHAVEESEHKSVAFDVYQEQVGDYWTRVNYATIVPPGKSTVTMPTGIYVGEKSRPGRPLLKDKITDKFYSFDASLLPDGAYTVKVVASDAPSHSPEEALTSARESQRFEIDTTPPQVVNLNAAFDSNALHITFRAIDGFSTIRRAEYSVDAGEWQYVEPVGRLSDYRVENYDFSAAIPGEQAKTVAESAGGEAARKKAGRRVVSGGDGSMATAPAQEHVIVVRVYDRFENMGSAKFVVRAR